MDIKVSVVITVYNVEKYINSCLLSVMNQSIKEIEIIVVNDGTPDNSMQIVKSLADKDRRIVIIDNAENKGLAMARRDGYLFAHSNNIVFLDSDDTLPNNSIEILYYTSLKYNVEIVKGCLMVRTCSGSEWMFNEQQLNVYHNKEEIFKLLLDGKITHNLAGCLFKKSILTNSNIVTIDKMTNSEDAFLFYQLINNLKEGIVTIPNVVYYYYSNSSSSTHLNFTDETIKKMMIVQKFKIKMSKKYTAIADSFIHSVVRYLLFASLISGNNRIKKIAAEEKMSNYVSTLFRLKILGMKDYIDVIKYAISNLLNKIHIRSD